MHQQRAFDSHRFFRSDRTEPPRVVITASEDAAAVCWQVEPGQRIGMHRHPAGQDTWIVLSGEGEYFTHPGAAPQRLRPGMVAVAATGDWHGALNTGTVPLKFVSVVSPAESGFEPLP